MEADRSFCRLAVGNRIAEIADSDGGDADADQHTGEQYQHDRRKEKLYQKVRVLREVVESKAVRKDRDGNRERYNDREQLGVICCILLAQRTKCRDDHREEHYANSYTDDIYRVHPTSYPYF